MRFAAMVMLGKGLWLSHILWSEPNGLARDVLVSHAAIAVGALIVSMAVKGRPLWGKIAFLPVLTSFVLLELPQNLKLQMDPPWNIVLALWQISPVFIGLIGFSLVMADPDSYLQKFKERFHRSSKVLQIALSLLLSLCALELGLRQSGMAPGVIHRNEYLHQVDDLVEFETYSTDESGIYAVSSAARECLRKQLQAFDDPSVSKDWPEELYYGENWVQRDHLMMLSGELNNGYTHYLGRIREQATDQRDPVDQAYLDQLQDPINENGFRSIPFRNDSTQKTKVLMIGDSFTWGHSASYFSQAFSDLLILKGYAIYNAGISATDPAQYEAIAQKFVPMIKPDVVVVNLYMGNDIFYFRRPVVPFQAPLYLTNAGMLLAHPGPEWLPDADSAYAFIDREQRIPLTNFPGWSRFCSKTVLGTLMWRAASASGLIPFVRPNAAYWSRNTPLIRMRPVTGEHLRTIKAVATANGARFVLAVIPQFPEEAGEIKQKFEDVFQGLHPVIPLNLDPKDYAYRGGHFNDAGHRKFAEMLDDALQ